MPSNQPKVVILGTGGTIAGVAANPADGVGYQAAVLAVSSLVAAVPPLDGQPLECEQVAQLDSRDMSHTVWQRLAQRVAHHLAREEVAGVVITHGTDTLEETAYFLHRVLAPAKPVVLTAAMRPATALQADGPQNLFDAVQTARSPGACGVVVVMAGAVQHPADLRKRHSYRIDAFDSGDAGPIAWLAEGRLRQLRPWPQEPAMLSEALRRDAASWPRVDIVTSHAGADGAVVRALCASGTQGIVVAATGNGTVHHTLAQALHEAQTQGVRVLRASRCNEGGVVDAWSEPADALPSAGMLSPAKARIELLLSLLADDVPR